MAAVWAAVRSQARRAPAPAATPTAPRPRPADPCPICFAEPRDFPLSCGCAACFACLRQHAAAEVRAGQHPRCPLCLAAPGTSAAGAAADRARMSRAQLEVLLDEGQLLVLDRRQVGARCAAGLGGVRVMGSILTAMPTSPALLLSLPP